MNELITAAAFLGGAFLGAAGMYLQMKEITKTREEIKNGEIARLKFEVQTLKEKTAPDPYIPTFDEFKKISDQAALQAQIATIRKQQEVDYNGNF